MKINNKLNNLSIFNLIEYKKWIDNLYKNGIFNNCSTPLDILEKIFKYLPIRMNDGREIDVLNEDIALFSILYVYANKSMYH